MVTRPVLQRLGEWASATGCAGALGSDRDSGGRPELLVTAADHAVAAPVSGPLSPVSTLPWGHGSAEAARINDGESPLCSLAARQGVGVTVTEFPYSRESDAPPSSRVDEGREAADGVADAGTPLLLTGTLGTGATTTAAAVVGVLCNIEPVKVVGKGGGSRGITDEQWKHKTVAIRDLMFRARPYRRRPVDATAATEILDILGSPDLAFTAGLLAQSATRRTPVVLDGVSGLAAGLLADALTPGASRWWLLPDIPTEPGAAAAARRLSLQPVVDHPLGAPAAASGLVLLPLLDAAVTLTPQD
ncbi:nicotinate-nucleotide--dimethylbenzimidazole phosphoribosyltransferase [Corynebacterium kalidii]|jgi:nicotinate-nucleotide--dimethylbenzimidazole phosphoribosyltransferase|uniref:Nicotinate-nucleotide--dimethylbenzimidazole phosphoribosyltransferase n=1 Tax=Corynebacterium kalidii TaxID=2931982 RepID=A0A9X2B2A3_9CORY|nr:nicotinate-nucleotide--dimethylbenzimidazole phosphoribosyltransferase [Corynebacterium kalidii]MCJ7858570.1 nicotinate-nucleotide--dimethylbenzimidazole phosphoribosyltransferase [Corynebacterium kalidii]